MYLSPLGRLIQIYAYICAFGGWRGGRKAPGIMEFKVRCRLSRGQAALYYMTLFSLSLAPHLLVRPLRAGKILPLLHKLGIKRLRGQKEGRASGGGKKTREMRSVLWENEKGSGSGKTCIIGSVEKKKKTLRTKSLGKEEAQKSRRKLEAEQSQLGSRRPRSLDDKAKEENSKRGVKSARRRPRPWPKPPRKPPGRR